ncbi:MAG: DUF1643 domain-containing protein [Planctomycetes bacterium]|nr:DUF1643 domain-containing protein [Planctomycetota bacterium]
MGNVLIKKHAIFSRDREYRYTLWRLWDSNKGYAMFICLNPSTADEESDDNTVRRCVGYAKKWGYGGVCIANLFAFRATKPRKMKAAKDPIGPKNDSWIKFLAIRAGVVVAAWGCNGGFKGRDTEVRNIIPRLHYLVFTKDGHPSHPLFLKKGLQPKEWRVKNGRISSSSK